MGARWHEIKRRVQEARKKSLNWATRTAAPWLKGLGREIAPTNLPIYIVCFACLTAFFYRWSEPAQPWIELLNGATWPSAATPPASAPAAKASAGVPHTAAAGATVAIAAAPPSVPATAPDQPYYMQADPWDKVWFNLVLALRTMVNLSVVVGVVVAVLAYRRLKESAMFMVKVEEILKVRDLSISRGIRDAFLNAEEKARLEHDDDGTYFQQLVNRLGQRFEKDELPALLDSQGLKSLKEFTIRVG